MKPRVAAVLYPIIALCAAAFEAEMRAGGVDWRLYLFGGAAHSFTNENASLAGIAGVEYHAPTDARTWRVMLDVFDERLGSV